MTNQILENSQLEVGKYYHCYTKTTGRHSIELCKDGVCAGEPKYLANRIWADDNNNQALGLWDIYGPIEVPKI